MNGSTKITPEGVVRVLTKAAEFSPGLPDTQNGVKGICESVENAGNVVRRIYSLIELRFRYQIGDAREDLKEAIARAEKLAEYWDRWQSLSGEITNTAKPLKGGGEPVSYSLFPDRIDGVGFRFAAAAIISLLQYDEMSPILLKVCPRTSHFDDIRSPYHYWNFPDAGLVEMLQTGEEPERWDDMMDESEDWFGCTDLEENFRSYANIILEAKRGNWDAAVDAVRVSEELYETRPDMTDEVAVFEAWELPYPKEAKGIDLRLSALMRYCFRDNPEVIAPLNSVHRWKW